MLTPKRIPGATWGEAWPGGLLITTQTVPPGCNNTPIQIRVASDGRIVGKTQQGFNIPYWNGTKWTDIYVGVTPNFPVAFHPTSGEIYLALADIHVFDRNGKFVRTQPWTYASSGIKQVLSDGSVVSGDASYGYHKLEGQEELVGILHIGQGLTGGVVAVGPNDDRHYLCDGVPMDPGPLSNMIGDRLVIYWTDYHNGFLIETTTQEILTLPDKVSIVVSTPPIATAPPSQSPPTPSPAPQPSEPPVSDSTPFDWQTVQFLGGSPNVAGWAETTRITRVSWDQKGLELDFSARDTWPDVVYPGWQGPLQFTVWLVQPDGKGGWVTAGFIQCWKGLTEIGGDMTDPTQIGRNWAYFVNPPMHQPAAGERIGVFVTSGNQRKGDQHQITERSNVVFMPWTPGATFTFSGDPIPAPTPEPTPTPTPTPQPTPTPVPADDPRFAQLQAEIDALKAQVAALPAPTPIPDLSKVAHKGDKVTVTETLFGTKLVAHGTIDL